MNSVATGLLPILGVVIGALLQWWFARSGNAHKQLLELRTKAYTDFFAVVSQVATAGREPDGSQTDREIISRLADAKARVCIYGEEAVVRELADFWSGGANLKTEEGRAAFGRFCIKVRESVGVNDGRPLGEQVQLLIFGTNSAQAIRKEDGKNSMKAGTPISYAFNIPRPTKPLRS